MKQSIRGEIQSLSGASLEFVAQDKKTSIPNQSYEARIYLKGEIQTRTQNWHDFFQVLIWCTYTKTKQRINKIHYLSFSNRMNNHSTSNRSNEENTLTLFDECGAIIVSSDPVLLELIRNFEWSELFIHNRDLFETKIKCFIFGHALYEKCLAPYVGMTAHSLCMQVDPSFFLLDECHQQDQIDKLVEHFFCQQDRLTPKIFHPFPILGVPNWDIRNSDPGFYQNKEYFRKKRYKNSSPAHSLTNRPSNTT